MTRDEEVVMTRHMFIAPILVMAFGLASSIGGQPRAAVFEVASVKRSDPNGRLSFSSYKGEIFTLPKATLASLIHFAYGIGPLSEKPFAVLEGEPSWRNDRFDIVARTPGPVPPPSSRAPGPLNEMVRALLAERFKLVVHWEQREGPVYALVLSRADRVLGRGIRPSSIDCEAYRAERKAAIASGTLDPAPPVLGAPRERPVCGADGGPQRDGMKDVPGTREILLGTEPLARLAFMLRQEVDRPIVDRTGLSGNYDVELRFAPARLATGPSPGALPVLPPIASDPGWPALADALRDQLGLKIEPARGPVDVLVIDSVEPPTEN
jgi:uncharacterized protein (TIGR03435 family)